MNETDKRQSFPTESLGFLIVADIFMLSVAFFFIIQDERGFRGVLRSTAFGIGVLALPFLLGLAAKGLARSSGATESIFLYHRVIQVSCIVMGLAVFSFGMFGLFYELGRP
ncbi:MAG: hypothetical protein ACYTG0_41845 [Planctomycetota bacterium]|jgi:hypothetical protein